jgi:outer membrane protein assembly factor BamB
MGLHTRYHGMRMKVLSIVLFVCAAAGAAGAAELFGEDPSPPKAAELSDAPAPEASTFDRLTFHAAPKPLAKEAVTTDWPAVLGPNDDATSPETPLLHTWPEGGPAKVWEVRKGEGYTSPAISGEHLVIFHAMEGKEVIECLHPETGKRYWVHEYPISYKDRFGYANGPRGSPSIADGRVVTIGVTCMMTCLDLKTGSIAWQRDLQKEFLVPQDFFGHGGSALLMDGMAIVNVGGKAEMALDTDDMEDRAKKLATPGLCVGAFDLKTGKLIWGVKDSWGASYATPVAATMHGKKKVFVFTGGESNPATGGLLCIDPKDGTVHDRIPWRANDYTSATASSPVVIPEKNRVFISTAYPKGRPLGGVMLEFDEKFKAKEVWKSERLATHWMNPVYVDGYLYAIDGELQQSSKLVCVNADTGEEKWREDVIWEEKALARPGRGGAPGSAPVLGIQRASLLRVDGKFLVLSELGSLLWMDLSPSGAKVEARMPLFFAPHTWCLPAVSKGLLYVMQNDDEQALGSSGPRILCYDLRAAAK